jgi:hypothetical protein
MKKAIHLLAIMLISCGPSAKFVSRDCEKPQIIALLPTNNQTTDVNGAIVFRNLLYEKLRDKKYAKLLDIAVVDSLLNEQGITDGGQLATIGKEELFKALFVDGLLFIDLLACDYQTLGFSETRKVEANCKLYVLPSKLAWEDERKTSKGKSAVVSLFRALFNPTAALEESAIDFGKQIMPKGQKRGYWITS